VIDDTVKMQYGPFSSSKVTSPSDKPMPTVTEHGLSFTHFNALDVAPQERFERWQQRLSDTFQLTLPEGTPSEDLAAETWVWMVGGMMLSPRICGAHTLTRTSRTVRATHLDHYKLHLRVGGTGVSRLEAGERCIAVGANRFALTDMSRPEQLSADEGSTIAMFIPRAALDALLPRSLDLHGFAPQNACGAMLASHLNSLVRHMPSMTAGELTGVRNATLHLLAASLAPSTQTLGLAQPALEDTLRRQICGFIDQHLSDPDLSADRLCANFKISRSTLYRTFEPLGGVASYIKECRLNRIHALLSAPKPRRYMARVAEDHGFKSPTHFSRAFRAQFGYSPSDAPGKIAGPVAPPYRGTPRTASAFESWLQTL
jgi:AraC-like DNA-binding protein